MNRVVATILSVFFPGAGQLSNGQPLKGIAAIVLTFVSLFVVNVWFGYFPYLFWLIWALCIIDAVVVGGKRDARGDKVRKGGAIAGSIVSFGMFGVYGVIWVISLFFGVSDSQKVELSQQAEQKLHDTYHQDFTVKVDSSNLFETGLVYMTGAPKSDPKVTFPVEMTPDGTTFTEQYMDALLSAQGLPELQKRVDAAFPDDHLVYAINSLEGKFEGDRKAQGQLPIRYQDMVAHDPDKLNQDVRIYLFGTYNAEKEAQTMDNVMRFLSGFSDAEKQNLRFDVDWYDPSMKENLAEKTGYAMYDYKLTHSGLNELFTLSVWSGQVPKIKTVEDLKKYRDK